MVFWVSPILFQTKMPSNGSHTRRLVYFRVKRWWAGKHGLMQWSWGELGVRIDPKHHHTPTMSPPVSVVDQELSFSLLGSLRTIRTFLWPTGLFGSSVRISGLHLDRRMNPELWPCLIHVRSAAVLLLDEAASAPGVFRLCLAKPTSCCQTGSICFAGSYQPNWGRLNDQKDVAIVFLSFFFKA